MLWFICLDKDQGYHQIGGRKCDCQKLAFFGPEGLKWTFKVLLFGPTNAPPFYAAMIRNFQDKWTLLFRLECNKQNINYDNKQTSQPASICRLLYTTDDYDKSCNAAVMPNLKIYEEFTLSSEGSPLCSKSPKSIPN